MTVDMPSLAAMMERMLGQGLSNMERRLEGKMWITMGAAFAEQAEGEAMEEDFAFPDNTEVFDLTEEPREMMR